MTNRIRCAQCRCDLPVEQLGDIAIAACAACGWHYRGYDMGNLSYSVERQADGWMVAFYDAEGQDIAVRTLLFADDPDAALMAAESAGNDWVVFGELPALFPD